MNKNQKELVEGLLARHGEMSFSGALGLDLARNSPSHLFCWLCATLLMSARISADLAMRAAGALAEAGWTTADKMAKSTWEERVKVLNRAGYARYDESTARMLGDTVSLLIDEYGGDLRKLRDKAGRDPEKERKLLQEFKGIGEVGADIFFRDVQVAWDEFYPFADKLALKEAAGLGLPENAGELAKCVSRADFPRLLAALVRAKREGEGADALRDAAREAEQ